MQAEARKYVISHTGKREDQKQDKDEHHHRAMKCLHGHTQFEGCSQFCKHESKKERDSD